MKLGVIIALVIVSDVLAGIVSLHSSVTKLSFGMAYFSNLCRRSVLTEERGFSLGSQ
jgi:hypothetical protein